MLSYTGTSNELLVSALTVEIRSVVEQLSSPADISNEQILLVCTIMHFNLLSLFD